MKKIFFSITCILTLIACILTLKVTSIRTAIVQSYAITDVRKYLNPALKPADILIVFDIDNTIAESANQLASAQWFTAMHKIKELCGMTKIEAIKATLPLYSLLVEHCPLQPVESTTVALIKELQNTGYKVMSLTVRSPEELKTCTVNQLAQIDIDFTRNPIYPKNIIFNNNVQYIQGILFVDGGNKGEWLLHILNHIGYMPKQIIFIDDKEYNHHAVEDALGRKGIEHTCIWYRYCDAKVDTFDLAFTETALLDLCQRYPAIRTAYQKWLYPFAAYSDMIAHACKAPA
jgi:hypothetical protein